MKDLLCGLVLSGLVMAWVADAHAERGDHDTPATERQSEGVKPLKIRNCPTNDLSCEVRRILPRSVVVDWLNDWDFVDLRDLRLRDDVYTVEAIDPYGRPVRLTIDAVDGRILRRDPR